MRGSSTCVQDNALCQPSMPITQVASVCNEPVETKAHCPDGPRCAFQFVLPLFVAVGLHPPPKMRQPLVHSVVDTHTHTQKKNIDTSAVLPERISTITSRDRLCHT